MTPPAPRFSEYAWDRGREWIMSFGPEDGPQLLIAPPLLEELNRTRKLLSDTMRALAEHGIGSHLPDLVGTAESEKSLITVHWDDWQGSISAAVKASQSETVFSLRGGCLIDGNAGASQTIHFMPVEGKHLIRDLIRARSVTDETFDSAAQKAVFAGGTTFLGGYPITAKMAVALGDAMPSADPDFVIRLDGDRGDADAYVAGPPLWRRAEPSGSPEMATALADIIAGKLL